MATWMEVKEIHGVVKVTALHLPVHRAFQTCRWGCKHHACACHTLSADHEGASPAIYVHTLLVLAALCHGHQMVGIHLTQLQRLVGCFYEQPGLAVHGLCKVAFGYHACT